MKKKEETFGIDEKEITEQEDMEKSIEENKVMQFPRKKPFTYWKVGEKEYKLKLKASDICKLEEKFKQNLLNVVTNGLPSLGIMLTIIQASIINMEHNIRFVDIQNIYDKYVEDGGTQLTLYTDVIMSIMAVSGFFTENQTEALEEKMADVKEVM